jgi:hypothetical protein
MTKTPYEVRLELLKLSKEAAYENMYKEVSEAGDDLERLRNVKAVTTDEIITEARLLNEFVTNE